MIEDGRHVGKVSGEVGDIGGLGAAEPERAELVG